LFAVAEGYRQVGAADITKVAARYFDAARRTVVIAEPDGSDGEGEE
jgi:predicted Zn-dependent peptidase